METDVTRGQASWAKMMSPVGKLTVMQKNCLEYGYSMQHCKKKLFLMPHYCSIAKTVMKMTHYYSVAKAVSKMPC
jgi:hypothetical protein